MRKSFFITLCAASLILLCQSALAAIGQNGDSAEQDRLALHGIRRVSLHSDYTVHEITTDGNIVREYESPSGMIFAIAWKGVSQPDLTQLLGSYFLEYREARRLSARPASRAPASISSKNLRGIRFGHMGAARGIIVMPSLLPAGVDLSEIQ